MGSMKRHDITCRCRVFCEAPASRYLETIQYSFFETYTPHSKVPAFLKLFLASFWGRACDMERFTNDWLGAKKRINTPLSFRASQYCYTDVLSALWVTKRRKVMTRVENSHAFIHAW